MVDGTTIAAILTGILALVGALATAWMSGWNERRTQARQNRKALARYAVPLLIAAWDLANWFYDILEESNYSPRRCNAYGSGWNSQFTSYLIGQYFAGVHIIREKTHFLAHIRGERADKLKQLLWKIQDEFISMHYEGRESLAMRWFEGDVLAVQEHMTEVCDLDGDGNAGEMRTIGWNEFQEKYPIKEPGSNDSKTLELKKIFDWYETEFQRIIYRRFTHLYSTKWNREELETQYDCLPGEDSTIQKEREANPGAGMVIPDHRVRRLQHLLSDLVEVLDELSKMKFNRPVRRCEMLADRVACDCHSVECNPTQQDFAHRQLAISRRMQGHSRDGNTFDYAARVPSRQVSFGIRRKKTDSFGLGRKRTEEKNGTAYATSQSNMPV